MNAIAEGPVYPDESLSIDSPTVKRRRKFWLGYLMGLLCVGFMVWTVVNCVQSVMPILEQAASRRALMPGTAVFELDAGRYAIDYDTRSTLMGKPFRSPQLSVESPVGCQLVNVDTGVELPLTNAFFHGSYSLRSGDAVYEGARLYLVEIDQSGRYELRGESLAEHPDATYVLAIDDVAFPPRSGRAVLLIVAGSFIGLIGLGILLVTVVLHIVHAIRGRKS
jgi:hypothetical protein